MAARRLRELAGAHPGFEVVRLERGRAGARYEVVHRESGLRSACVLPTLASCEQVILGFDRDRGNRGYWR